MFLDPLPIGGITATTIGAATNYDRIGDGLYLASNTTLDTPVLFSVQNTIDPNGISSFVAKVTQAKNAPGTVPYGEKPQPDDVAQVHVVYRQPHRSFSNAEMLVLRDILCGFQYTSGYMGKFLSGQK